MPTSRRKPSVDFDVLIIGSGIAGLSLALHLAPIAHVGLITKLDLTQSASQYAQGGIAAVTQHQDFASHIADTLTAGAGLSDPETVAFTVSQSAQAIHWLIQQGVAFTRDPQSPHQFHLTQEGGHSCRRIYHVADSTGAAVMRTLIQKVAHTPNIHCLTQHTALELLVADQQCYGAQVACFDSASKQTHIRHLLARCTVLASGGASAIYLHSTNPNVNAGDGLAMAWRAGCRLANLEFTQFHPTSLYHPQANTFLISEAVRGEGGILLLPNGKRFMLDYDKRGELAPRDIVARAIALEMQRNQLQHVLLNISHKPADEIWRLFPMIAQRCQQLGIDMTREPIPVVPAAHYTCGGIITNHDACTDITQLYAIGEVAYTGLHGANRMASNSLLECLVFAQSASQHIQQYLQKTTPSPPPFKDFFKPLAPPWDESKTILIEQLRLQLRYIMFKHMGIIRSNQDILQAQQHVQQLARIMTEECGHMREHPGRLALFNPIQVAQLMITSAQLRQESRGCHYNVDYPQTNLEARPTLLQPMAQALEPKTILHQDIITGYA